MVKHTQTIIRRLFINNCLSVSDHFVELALKGSNTGTLDETFLQSGKQNSFRQILKSSADVYESSGSQFLKTTTRIQSGPDTFDKSRFIMTFLTIFGVTEICSFT